MTTSVIAWHRTMRTPATTSTERECTFSQLVLFHIIRTHMHRGSSLNVCAFTPSPCAWSSVRSLHLDPPFLFPALPSVPFPLPQVPEVCGKTCTTPATRVWTPLASSSSPQVMSPRPTTSTRPQSSPTCSSWTRRLSFPTKSLLRTPTTMTLHSKTCSIKYIERKPITLYEKTCLSVCRRRRQCPIEQGDLLEIDRGDPVSTEAQKHRLGLCSTIKKSKFFQSAKQELISTNFKQLEPKKINDFCKDNYYSRIWNYVKLIKEVSLKWKS